jgi:hypothetical protein
MGSDADGTAAPKTTEMSPTASPSHEVEPAYVEKSPQLRQRFCIERATFILTISIIAAIAIRQDIDVQTFVIAFGIACAIIFVYAIASFSYEIDGFTESISEGSVIPKFDWKHFLLEPIRFMGILLAVLALFGLMWLHRWITGWN